MLCPAVRTAVHPERDDLIAVLLIPDYGDEPHRPHPGVGADEVLRAASPGNAERGTEGCTGGDRLSSINLAQSSASVANAGAEMARGRYAELLSPEQGRREHDPCVIAEERPANQAGLSTWTCQFRKVARRTDIADWTMNTLGFFF